MQTYCTAPECASPALGRLEEPLGVGVARLLSGDLCDGHLLGAIKAHIPARPMLAVRRAAA